MADFETEGMRYTAEAEELKILRPLGSTHFLWFLIGVRRRLLRKGTPGGQPMAEGRTCRSKCASCKFWWPNTPEGVVAEADRRKRHKCLHSVPLVGGKSGACRNFRKFKKFFMVPWDAVTFIKIEAESEEEMLEKVGAIARKIAGPVIESILKEHDQCPSG